MNTEDTRGRTPNKGNAALWGCSSAMNSMKRFNHLPTTINGALTQEQLIAYQTMFRIQEITSKLRMNEFQIPERKNRSPSPPPAYDARGRRTNTREQRYKRKLEEERHRLVEIALKLIPHFVAPEDYKRPTKFQDKYYIPVSQYPDINFVGLLLGPRGNTLKKLQEDSQCKIAIRGRGSVKEGKNANDLPQGAMNFSDPLHCLIIADTEEKVQKGLKVCENIVVKAVTSPEGQNDLKRGQLRELAELNGTLREDNRPCQNCGLEGHKKYDCPSKETYASRIICNRCGQSGHVTRDCNADMSTQNNGYQGKPKRYNMDEYNYEQRDWKRRHIYNNNGYNSNSYENESQEVITSYRSRNTRSAIPTGYDTSNRQYSTHANMSSSDPLIGMPQHNAVELTNHQYNSYGNSNNNAEINSAAAVSDSKDQHDAQSQPSRELTPGIPSGISDSYSLAAPPGLTGPPGLGTPPGLDAPPGLDDTNGQNTLQLPPGLSGPPGL
ncbi:hypothetical protein Kpol_1036p60 [Vanderwaltozyma polyspora DSM 70294]|uniref:Branchpoint-bridging protein n=1 Tax=Vanderwaltozyma polyspora (strain ATCC 22028 / DSM 70294 / BCRC 21397 / CBS 2163 / NBRC 10782 / NRRL Y-8283 / UCD 57-17) TaxID=436907 RepID=A7TEK8_VANPO|nr:uncharacterized protein Kpol_1036p60 [Vanderwaltozyma polyspora DSM 70294]EDO19315.1 hypothetical protein Kpol_1036p60 [Vanderwaltozyma polyspora DSM 70294]